MKNMIIAHNGSVQNIPTIPDDVKAIYKTVLEISPKKVLDLAADRGAFICQSLSLNAHLQSLSMSLGQLTSMYFYEWKKGSKMGMYYLRTRPGAQAIQFRGILVTLSYL
jgi:ribonucleoside-diphosphate reductase subunit M1